MSSSAIRDHIQGLRPPPRPVRDASTKSYLALMGEMTFVQWVTFFTGWLAWTCDALDFFAVSLTVPQLQKTFDRSTHTITTSITLTLLFRSFGALGFGLASDRYGRKWPLVLCMIAIVALQIATSFTKTFEAFLACRSLFGIAMGGVWGMASATSLEAIPVELRGLASGIIQEGYATGYLIAAVINLTLVPDNSHSWRALFWVAAGLSAFAGILRAIVPESEIFLRAKQERKDAKAAAVARGEVIPSASKVFLKETSRMLQLHWKLCIYAVLLMTGFNFLSHGSQDLYPTYLQVSKGLSSKLATKATIIGNCGAIAGGTISGMFSQRLGRRLTMAVFILSIGLFIPVWILPSSFSGLAAGAFCVQFGVQGAWGIIPIHLAEMSPPAFRATFPGLMYQLGNMVSSASAQIEATGGEHLRTTLKGKNVPDYAKVQGILIGTVAIFTIIVVLVGPENRGSRFEEHAAAFQEGGGLDDAYVGADEIRAHRKASDDPESRAPSEKGVEIQAIENRDAVHEKL